MSEEDLITENAALRALCKRALALLKEYQSQTLPSGPSEVTIIDNRKVAATRSDTARLLQSAPWS